MTSCCDVPSELSGSTCCEQIRDVIRHTYGSATDENCRLVEVKAHEVRKIATSLLIIKNCTLQQVLKVGTWPFPLCHIPLRCHPLVLWWWLKRLCNSIALLDTSVVTVVLVCSWWSVICSYLDPHIQHLVVILFSTLSFYLRSSELQKLYTLEPLISS